MFIPICKGGGNNILYKKDTVLVGVAMPVTCFKIWYDPVSVYYFIRLDIQVFLRRNLAEDK